MDWSKYKRVLIKISGEALAGDKKTGIDFDIARAVCEKIKECHDHGVQIAIVVGAGNFWRGGKGNDLDRTRADHMGMLATMMNCLALQDTFKKIDIDCRVLAAIDMQQFAEPYIRDKAVAHLENNKIVIFGCGTGNPFFTTDTAAALRAVEIAADVLLLAKSIDFVYEYDPNKPVPEGKENFKYEKISYLDILSKELSVIDTTAAALLKDNSLPAQLFELGNGDNIVNAVKGDNIGTLICKETKKMLV